MACKAYVTFLFSYATEGVVPFDLQASSEDVGVAPWQLVLELAVPQGVADDAEEGTLGLCVRVYREVEEGILGIVVVVVVV
jgi:hypothetical protein